MKHTYCKCYCGHSREQHSVSGRCRHLDNDGGGYFDPCDCDEFCCSYAGKKWSGTVRGGCIKATVTTIAPDGTVTEHEGHEGITQ